MKTTAIALAAALSLASCSAGDPVDACGAPGTNPCQQACEITGSGPIGTTCDPIGYVHPPCTEYDCTINCGTCLCTEDGECPSGWRPHLAAVR